VTGLATAAGSVPASPDPDPAPPAVRVAVIGDTIAEARRRYAAATSLPRRDCDQISDGRWICASFSNPRLSDVDGEPSTPPPSNPPSNPPNNPPSNPPSGGGQAIPGDSLFSRGDLIVLNYDSCPDADDIHASTMALVVMIFHAVPTSSVLRESSTSSMEITGMMPSTRKQQR